MLNKANPSFLRIADNVQYLLSANRIFGQHKVEPEKLTAFYDELNRLCGEIERSVALDKGSDKIKAKNAADKLRERRHSRAFTYFQSILFDETDERYAHAALVMDVFKGIGTPRGLSENAENTLFLSLEKSLEPLAADIEAAGATRLVAEMLEANRAYLALEEECRNISAQQSQRTSTGTLCRQANAVNRIIVNAINTFIALNGPEAYRAVETDINDMVAKYDQLSATRRTNAAKKAASATETGAAQ